MNKFFLITALFVCFSISQSFAGSFSYDSTGITKKAGKTFIVHVIEQGETLYSLSRRYHVDVDMIAQENPETESGLKIGQKILVPFVEEKAVPENAHVHVVKGGETLYSLARVYGVTTADLKKWNSLTDNTIGIGDKIIIKRPEENAKRPQTSIDTPSKPISSDRNKKIHVVKPSETLFSISRMYDVKVADIKNWNDLKTNSIDVGQELIVGEGKTEAPANNSSSSANSSLLPYEESTGKPDNKDDKISSDVVSSIDNNDIYTVEDETEDAKETYENKKIIQNGFAEVIEGSNETKKYLALHRSAPVGTIMQVRNEMNNQTVFVRVVGAIPNTDNNKNLIIKISKKAFDRLGAVDSKFPVELSYIP